MGVLLGDETSAGGMNLGLCDVTSGRRVLKRPGILGERPYASMWKCRDDGGS